MGLVNLVDEFGWNQAELTFVRFGEIGEIVGAFGGDGKESAILGEEVIAIDAKFFLVGDLADDAKLVFLGDVAFLGGGDGDGAAADACD